MCRLARVAVAAVLGLTACSSDSPPPADLIIHNARIYTVDATDSVAEAIAVAGDRIVAVGSDAEVLQRQGDETRLIDAQQAAMVPGLHDAHGHFTGLGGSLQNVDFRGTASYEEVIEHVRRRIESAAPGEWVLGRGWDQNDWPDPEWPTHDALSAISPNNPVYLTRIDGHAGLANRQALAAAGVTRATPDPDGGRILRTPAGEPTGVLVDRAEDLVTARIPSISHDRIEAQARLADRAVSRLGLTMVHDAGILETTVRMTIIGGRVVHDEGRAAAD